MAACWSPSGRAACASSSATAASVRRSPACLRISVGGQCGLLDVALDPQFASNGLIYWSYAESASAPDSGNSTAVARGKLAGQPLTDVRTIFVQRPKVSSSAHCGSPAGVRARRALVRHAR